MYERSDGYRIVKTTYGEAHDDILKKAGTLRSLLAGLPENAVVGLCMQSDLDWIEAFWAILAAGFRPLLINYRLDDAALSKAIADCGALAVISGGSAIDRRVMEFFNGVGYHLADGYGATEIGITSVELSGRAAGRGAGRRAHLPAPRPVRSQRRRLCRRERTRQSAGGAAAGGQEPRQ